MVKWRMYSCCSISRPPRTVAAATPYRMRRRALGRLATDFARLEQLDGNARSDASQRAAPPHDIGDALFIDAVLQGNHIAAGREIRLDELGRPFGVVGLHAHEGDIHRRLLREGCDLVQMHGFRMGNLPLFRGHPGELDAVPADGLDMLVPEVDQRHIVAMQRKMSAHIAADGTAAEHHDALTHYFLPPLLGTAVFCPRKRSNRN